MYKKILVLFLVCSLFFSISLYSNSLSQAFGSRNITSNTQNANGKTGIVSWCWRLNVRSGPWGKVLGVIAVNDVIKIIGTSSDNYWYKINYKGQTGYVSHKYINVSGTGTPPVAATPGNSSNSQTFANKKKGYTSASVLNIRKSPWGTILDKYSYGTDVVIVGKTGDWYKIEYKGGVAYAHSNYVRDGSAPSQTTGSPSGQPPQATFTSGPLSQRILQSMRSLENERLNYPSACAKNGQPGYLGCAYAVSVALRRAGVNVYSLGVGPLCTQLQRKPKPGFIKLPASQRQAGDVISWGGHIGVMAEPGRAVSNSSSMSRVREHRDTYMSIQFVLRAPA